MVFIIEKALRIQISASENRLLNVLRAMICKTGIFDIELSEVELAFGSDSSTITSNQINEKLLFTTVNKVSN